MMRDWPPLFRSPRSLAMAVMVGWAIFIGFSLAAPGARADQDALATGLWRLTDGRTVETSTLVRIQEEDARYNGYIVQIFPDPGEPADPICRPCKGELKGRHIVGFPLIRNMRRQGLEYRDGIITDPETGNRYDAVMQVSPDGMSLTVRGYIGLPVLGQSQVWRRADAEPRDRVLH